MTVRLLELVAVLLAVAFASPAFGQGGAPRSADDERARVLYENGAILYEEGQYEDAVTAWQQAYELSDRPLFLFNIANALERIGRWTEALEYLNRYRAFAAAEERTVLERRMRNIERRLDAARETAAESAGERGRREEAAAAERREKEEARRAEARAEAEADAAAEAEAEAALTSGPPSGPLVPGVVLMGVGGGLLATGGALAGIALTARAEAAAQCKDLGDSVLCPVAAEAALDRDARLSLGSDIAFGIGAGVAATGLVLVLAQLTRGTEATAQWKALPTSGPTGLGIGVVGRFP